MNRRSAVRDRLRDPVVFDRTLAALFLAGGVGEMLLLDVPRSHRAVVAVCAVTLAVLVAFRRRIAAVGLVTVAASLVAIRLLADDSANEVTFPFVTLFVFAYSLGAYGTTRAAIVGSTIAGVCVAVELV